MVEYLDLKLSKESCNHITVSKKGGLSLFVQRIMKNSMCFLNVGSFRAFMSKNCGKNVRYLGPDHCLDRKEMREELKRRGTKIDSVFVEGKKRFCVAGQYEVARGLGFFDVNNKGSNIICNPEFTELSLVDESDFVFVATKNIHKKVPSGKISFIIFNHMIKGIEESNSLDYILLEIMLEVLEEALIASLDHTQMRITLSKGFLAKFEQKNIDFFEVGAKILRFSSIIDDVEVNKKRISPYISIKNLKKEDKNVKSLLCCFK